MFKLDKLLEADFKIIRNRIRDLEKKLPSQTSMTESFINPVHQPRSNEFNNFS